MINETTPLTMNSVIGNQGIPIPLPSKLPSRTPVESYQLETEMKLLFVNPNLRPGNPTGKFLPVGLAYVMTVFRNVGMDYYLLDNRSTYTLLVLLTQFGIHQLSLLKPVWHSSPPMTFSIGRPSSISAIRPKMGVNSPK